MTQSFNLFATAPKGLELLLVDELRALGATNVAEKLAGVSFTGDLTVAYKACLWSRFANRILFHLADSPAATPEALYAGVQTIAWDKHVQIDGTIAVHCVCSQSAITHSLFAAQKIKDAIVDQLRDKFGSRPNVSRERPDVNVYVYLHRDVAHISIDLSGESLHKRGYRLASGAAPLKENLAAAILTRANWPAISKEGGTLMDPMCGSGTLLIEGALIAADIAPGLLRQYFGFLGWKQHKKTLWESLVSEAVARRENGLKHLPTIVGYDQNPDAIKIAFENIERAGMHGHIHVEKRDLSVFTAKSNAKVGLVVVNPPYGERLGEIEGLRSLYAELGAKLKQGFVAWHAAVFTGNPDLGKLMGLRSKRSYALFNGLIPCKLLLFDVQEQWFIDNSPEAENERRIRAAKRALTDADREAVQMFVNRLRKNLKHYHKQATQQERYRIYDADIPEYKFAIDLTADAAYVTEYPAPRGVNEKKILTHRNQVLAVLAEVLELPDSKIFFME